MAELARDRREAAEQGQELGDVVAARRSRRAPAAAHRCLSAKQMGLVTMYCCCCDLGTGTLIERI